MDENFFNLKILKSGMICPHTATKNQKIKKSKKKEGEFTSLVNIGFASLVNRGFASLVNRD
jgi:hypothetical protein